MGTNTNLFLQHCSQTSGLHFRRVDFECIEAHSISSEALPGQVGTKLKYVYIECTSISIFLMIFLYYYYFIIVDLLQLVANY